MPRKVVLAGHCGPDSSYLRIAVSRADPTAQVSSAGDESELRRAVEGGADLILINRQLSYGFEDAFGVDAIARLRRLYPHVKLMLISDYPEARAQALAAGGVGGFGKSEIGTPRVTSVLQEALR